MHDIESTLSGSIGDGPIVNAAVDIYDNRNNLITTTTSYDNATYLSSIKEPDQYYPLTIEVKDGLDLVTNMAPDFTLDSVALGAGTKYINVNPFSTMIRDMVLTSYGVLSDTSISAARTTVTTQMNFGLDPTFVADPITTQITESNVAVITKASETMGEMIRRVRDYMNMSGGTVINGNNVMAALVSDLSDGVIDGVGGKLTNPRISAISKLVSAQVLIEAMSNNLKVQAEVATSKLDAAIMVTHPSVSLAQLTDSVKINKEMLEQARKALYAAQALFSNTELIDLYNTVNSIQAGSLPSDVEKVLPNGSSDVLAPFITYLVYANNAQLTLVNKTTNISAATSSTPVDNTTLGSLSLNWTEPDNRVDNTALYSTEIASFTIYYGTSSGHYTNSVNVDGSTNTVTITDLPTGTYYLVMTTTDIDGHESSYSAEIVQNVQ